MLDVVNGQERARAWPKERGRKKHPKTAEQNEWFRQAQWATKFMAPEMYWQAQQAVQGTPLLPRDILTMMMAGRLAGFVAPDGRRLWSVAVQNDVSTALDVIADLPGSMLVRGVNGWQAILSGPAEYVLRSQGEDLPPIWSPGGGGGGGGGDQLLAEVVTGAGETSVHFDIPPTFRSFRIEGIAGSTNAAGNNTQVVYARFNGDAGAAKYAHTILGGYGAGGTFGNGVISEDRAGVGFIPSMGASGTTLGEFSLTVSEYLGGHEKIFRSQISGYQQNVGPLTATGSGVWRDTALISEVDLLAQADPFVAGSRFLLYGVSPLA